LLLSLNFLPNILGVSGKREEYNLVDGNDGSVVAGDIALGKNYGPFKTHAVSGATGTFKLQNGSMKLEGLC
jgi:hypothetical protein